MQFIKGKWFVPALLIVLLASCTKGGDSLIQPIQAVKPYSISGFAVQPLDQYFDGVKVRQLHGNVNSSMNMAFLKEESVMELKNSTTGEVLYTQKFSSKSNENVVPRFYFDGAGITDRFTYPVPKEGEYLASFFFDFPKELGAVDVCVVFVEYYFDSNLPQGYGIAGATAVPVATHIQTGKWSNYIQLPAMPNNPPQSRPDSDFMPFICLKKAGRDLYFTDSGDTTAVREYSKAELNSIPLELPWPGVQQGKVQSYYIGFTQFEGGAQLYPKQDLVQLFP